MQTTVRICGSDYLPCERVQDGAYWGIKTPDKTFWVFPVCDENGNEIKSLPPYLPSEIRAVTLEPPDLTQRYPETVKDIFDKRRAYFATATLSEYLKQFPNECWLTDEQFKKEQDRILGEPLEDFKRNRLLREMVWDRHGTQEQANECGYLGSVWETEIAEDGTEHRVSRHASIAIRLAFELEAARKLGQDAAWAIVSKLKFVMIYEGVPTSQLIYLEAMKPAAHAASQPVSATKVEKADELQDSSSGSNSVIQKVEALGGNIRLLWDKLDEVKSVVEKDKTASADKDQRLAVAQRELSAGLLIADPAGELQQKMNDEERFLFNQLVQPNPARSGWAKSYREIGTALGVTHTEVQRRRGELEAKYPALCRFIATARSKNDKETVHPDECDAGAKVETRGPNT